MFTTIDKAITAWVGSTIFIIGHTGVNVETLTSWETWLSGAAVGIVTYFWPNKAAA